MTVALSAIVWVMWLWKSSPTAIGTSGATWRMRRSSSPSPSSWLSLTMAPCRSSMTALQPAATASQIRSEIRSKAASATGPLGSA
jgi:hypothetical protein